MQKKLTNSFWQFDIHSWFQKLNTSTNGLSQNAVEASLRKSGTIKKARSHFSKDILLLVQQFKSPLMILLIGAVILSAVLGDTSDTFIIAFIITATSMLSFFQERNASRVVEKLESMISIKSTVMRDGVAREIVASGIVAGDILLFKAGDMVPADLLIIESNQLHANEASLTGESYPVRKQAGVLDENTELSKRSNCLWEGTSIVSGTARALVINTGADTVFGSIAWDASRNIETAFEKGINDFGYFLMKITLLLSAFILLVNLLNLKGLVESALFALAMAVGMAPELLPAITTIAMSAGAKLLLDKKVIVKKLSSIQNLGEVNLLCTDKTGTITEGNIKIHKIVDHAGKESDYVKTLAFWNATFETGYANVIDDALKKLTPISTSMPKKLGEVPYDFIRKRLSVAVDTGVENLLISKGAYPQIIEVCSQIHLEDGRLQDLSPYQDFLNQQFEQYGESGFRAVAICYKKISSGVFVKEDEAGMIFAGFILLQDPIKPQIQSTINELEKLQVGLKIITGDNKNVARSIASGIGNVDPIIITGKELFDISPEALELKVKQVHIFAEVDPQQKERVIHALRKSYTVAYMGDGINDVSAINAADIGISVDNAVDVAREAADFVLMEKDLSVLVDGIKEGRKTFANTLKYIFINTGSTFGNMFSVAIASILLPFLPMLPKQILLSNFITDFPFLAIAYDNVDVEQLEKPGKWDLKFIRNYMVIFGIHSSIFDVITFVTLLYVLKTKESAFQTGWFIESILTELFILFVIRTHNNFFRSLPGNYLFFLSLAGLILTIGLPYIPLAERVGLVPLPMTNLLAMLIIVTAYIVTADFLKVWFFRKYRTRSLN